jgi:drug/metabolite transporter (DMT)-like permease
MLMRNLDIVFVFIFDIFILNTAPDTWSYVGAGVIVLSTLLVAAKKLFSSKS